MAHGAWHLASAIACAPFSIAAAIGAVCPDVAWLPNEALIRRSKRKAQDVIDSLPSSALLFYRATHSVWTWALVAAWCPSLSIGALLHLAMDAPTHDGRMRQQPLWPLRWRWPKALVLRRFRRRDKRVASRCVLLSGGLDSAVALRQAIADGREGLWALFADYGQPYLAQEQQAVEQLSRLADIKVTYVSVDLIQELATTAEACHVVVQQPKRGTFPLRNLTLLRLAAQKGAQAVYIGTRCPLPMWDQHGDSNAVTLMQVAPRLNLEVRMPCLLLPKWLIRKRARQAWPQASIFSSEGFCYDSDQHHAQV